MPGDRDFRGFSGSCAPGAKGPRPQAREAKRWRPWITGTPSPPASGCEPGPTSRGFFGDTVGRMHEVPVRVETTDASVRVINVGPPKRMAWIYRFLLGIRRHHPCHEDWRTDFWRVYSVCDHWWADPATG